MPVKHGTRKSRQAILSVRSPAPRVQKALKGRPLYRAKRMQMRFLKHNEYSQPKGWNDFLLMGFQTLVFKLCDYERDKQGSDAYALRRNSPP